MNAQAAEALYEAERKGVRQIRGRMADGLGGYCALGVLARVSTALAVDTVRKHRNQPCGLCGVMVDDALVHLNDDHLLSFSQIARKLGPDSA